MISIYYQVNTSFGLIYSSAGNLDILKIRFNPVGIRFMCYLVI